LVFVVVDTIIAPRNYMSSSPAFVNVTLHGKGDFADVTKIMNLKIGRFPWIT
jgi:hypothetical protein